MLFRSIGTSSVSTSPDKKKGFSFYDLWHRGTYDQKLLGLGHFAQVGISIGQVLSPWSDLYNPSYGNVILTGGYGMATIPKVGDLPVIRDLFLELSLHYFYHHGKDAPNRVASDLHIMKSDFTLMWQWNFYPRLHLRLRGGFGGALTLQRYGIYNVTGTRTSTGSRTSTDFTYRGGAALVCDITGPWYCEVSLDWTGVLYKSESMGALRYGLAFGVKL